MDAWASPKFRRLQQVAMDALRTDPKARSPISTKGAAVAWDQPAVRLRLAACLIIVTSLAARLSLFDFESGDYRLYLAAWYDYLVEHGRWRGLNGVSQSYPPLFFYLLSLSTLLPLPKLYAIKLLSVAVDYLACWYVYRLVGMGNRPRYRPIAAVAILLLLPTVVMNSSLWGQCDIMYTCGFLASLYYLLVGRPLAALVAFGFSCALKPQAIFWCPLVAGMLVARRLPWKCAWVPLAVDIACGIPQMLAGRPMLHVLGHWGRAQSFPALTLGATNWYQWIGATHGGLWWGAGVALTLVATALFVWLAANQLRAGVNQERCLISLALLSVLFPPFLLPGMHERYFFAADVLAVVYAFYVPRGWLAAALIQFASAFAYFPFLFRLEPVPRPLLAVAIALAIELVVIELTRPAPPGGEG